MRCTEKNYISRLKKRKEDALEFIVDNYLGIVKAAIYKVLSPLERDGIIEECINDVFLSVWNNSDKFNGEELDFKKWIYKISKSKANIDSITKTSMSFIINYSQVVPDELKNKWFDMSLEIEAKDDLGNIYKGQGNGGYGNDNDNTMYWSKTFGKLDDKATKLIITPKMHLSNTGGGVSFDENGKETEIKHTIDADHPARGEIKFDDIVIDLEK